MTDHQFNIFMRITLTQLRNTILVTALMLLSGGGGWWWGQHQLKITSERKIPSVEIINRAVPVDKQDVDFSLFWEVWDRLEQGFLFQEKVNHQKMVMGAIAGMTAALDDPYTAFFAPADNKTAKENLNGAFEGVGIQLGFKKLDGTNQLAVMSPLSGMPAEKAGVKAGDYILKIVDESKGVNKETGSMSLPEAVEIIRGKKGTAVKLTLFTEGDKEPRVVEVNRDTIIVPSVEVKFGQVKDGQWQEDREGPIAWLKLTRFGGLTDEQWDKAVSEITNKGKNLRGVVLDLRNNPGGYLDGAVNLSGEFLPKGTLVVKQEHTGQPTQEYSVTRIGRLTQTPLIVLINKGSASASEILAGALRDHNRAKLVGETSFGKGTIQEAEDLRGGAGLHLTVARWLTPNGNWVHEKGLTPDVVIEPDKDKPTLDLPLTKAAEILLKD